jgi:flagellar biosynthesis protein FlhF
MKIKSYFAPTIQEAMEKARVELGPEAMLVSSKKSAPEAVRLGAYEVVFAVPSEGAETGPRQLTAVSRSAAVSRPATEATSEVARELADLRKQIEDVRRSVSRQGYSRALGTEKLPEFQQLHDMLVAADFSEELAQELVQTVAARVPVNPEAVRPFSSERGAADAEALVAALREEIEARFQVAPELGQRNQQQRIVAFVGPSGAGKTTALVKLAIKYGVTRRVPLQILSTDTLRVGGSEQLGAYARIMGAGFQAVPTMAALEQALEESRSKRIILIDTPGFGPGEIDEAEELKAFLEAHPEIDIHLVVPASLRQSAMTSVLARFAEFRPAKILFTRLDDADAIGAVLEPAIRSGLPISFLSNGQQIPDDVEEASKESLADKLFERVTAAASYAA